MSIRKNPVVPGERYGRLTLTGNYRRGSPGRYFLSAVCDCGNAGEYREDCLKSGNTKSCGCAHKDYLAARTDGAKYKSRTYRIWCGMRSRCRTKHKKWHLYGGKGVSVCDRWEVYENFLADMGEAPQGKSIDRINGDGDYEPSNCRWVTPKEQANNMSSNRFITYKNQTLTASQWAKKIGIKPNTLIYRLRRGWSVERALTQ